MVRRVVALDCQRAGASSPPWLNVNLGPRLRQAWPGGRPDSLNSLAVEATIGLAFFAFLLGSPVQALTGSPVGCFLAPDESCCETIPIRETVPNIPVAKGRGPGGRRWEAVARGTLPLTRDRKRHDTLQSIYGHFGELPGCGDVGRQRRVFGVSSTA